MWALIQRDWFPYKKGNLNTDTHTHTRENEGRNLQAKEHHGWPTNHQKLRKGWNKVFLTPSEGTNPNDLDLRLLGFRTVKLYVLLF